MILYDIGVELGRRELVSSDVERVDAAVVETVFLGTSVESWALSDPIFRGRATVAVVSGGDRVEVDVGGIGVEVKVSDIVRAANVAAMPIVQSEQYRMEGWEAFGYIHILSLLSKDGTWELALQHGAY